MKGEGYLMLCRASAYRDAERIAQGQDGKSQAEARGIRPTEDGSAEGEQMKTSRSRCYVTRRRTCQALILSIAALEPLAVARLVRLWGNEIRRDRHTLSRCLRLLSLRAENNS